MAQPSSFAFFDFDAFREHLRGWDTDPVQLEAGTLRIGWDELRLPEFGVSCLSVDPRVADTSAVAPGGLTFCVSFRPYVFCGVEVPAGSLVVLAPGRDYRCVHAPAFRSLEIFSSQRLIEDGGLRLDDADPRVFAPERSVLELPRQVLAEFECLAEEIRCLARAQPPAEGFGAGRHAELQWRTLGLVRRALRGRRSFPIRAVPRYSLVSSALRRMEERGIEERLTVAELARCLRVTPRALEYAFHDVFGVSPTHYLTVRRLNRVRRDLVMDERLSVTAAASRHGFDHLGRFSGQYRRLFQELPSRTQRRRA